MYALANLSEIMALIQKMVLAYGVLGKVGETSEATDCAQAVPMTAKRESLGQGEQGTRKQALVYTVFPPTAG